MIEGNPCVTLTGLTGQNGSNANLPAGNVVQTQQQKVLVAP
jgi:hypothetical protein